MALGPTTVLEPTHGSHHVSATLPPCMGFALLLSAVCVPVSLMVDGLASNLGQRSTLTSWSAGVIWGRAASSRRRAHVHAHMRVRRMCYEHYYGSLWRHS